MLIRRTISLAILIAVEFVFSQSASATDVKPFVRESMSSDAVHLIDAFRKDTISVGARFKGKTPEQLRRDGMALRESDLKAAAQSLEAAIAAAPKDAVNWLEYARLADFAEAQKVDRRYEVVDRGLTAAYAAFERSAVSGQQVEALKLLGSISAAREDWRLAIDADRAALDRKDDPDLHATYDKLREEHGFRIADYKVDNESAQPRICFNFSEPLARKTDFAPYVAVAGTSNSAISVEDKQLCVEGLAHGQRYAITLRQGIPSTVGENLLKKADYDIYVRDRSSQVHFGGKTYVLPRVGQLGAPLSTVNTSKVSIDVYRIGDRNLVVAAQRDDFLKQVDSSRARQLADQDGEKVWSGAMDVVSVLNKDVTTDFPITQAIGKMQPGVYLVAAKPWKAAKSVNASGEADSDDADIATQWIIVSDLGVTTFSGADGVRAMVRSLETTAPRAGVEIRLIAKNNEVLDVKTTDAEGRVAFDPGLSRGQGGAAPAMLVAVSGDDYGFLDLTQPAFDLSDRGVSGRDAPGALDAYIYTERGVYRSGETVHVAALLRDAAGVAKLGLPLTIVVKRPDGVEYKRQAVADQGLGGRALPLALLAGAPTGKWSIDAFADPKGSSVGHAEFLLEDYVPERLDFTVTAVKPAAAPGENVEASVDAHFLYGAPAAGLDVSGAIRLMAVPGAELPGKPGFVAGLTDEEFTTLENQFSDKVKTDDKGHVDLDIALPEGGTTKPMQVQLVVDVAEPGGRTVERVMTEPLRAKGAMIGVKKDFDEGLGAGDSAVFQVIAVAPDGAQVPRKSVEWNLYRVDTHYQWFNADGHWNFEPVKSSTRLAQGTTELGVSSAAKIAAQVGWGAHRLDVKSAEGEITSLSFNVGWSGTSTAVVPDNAVVTLDKANYAAGEEAKLRIASQTAGRATVALVGDKLERFIDVDLVAGDNVVPFRVDGNWGAGVYAVALTQRPLDARAKRMPGRAIGLAWFSVDSAMRSLEVSLEAPEKIAPRKTFDLPIKVSGLAAGEDAEITVAAVDIGILNLTKFKSPDPKTFFFGKRKLSLDLRDVYGYLIDGMDGALGAIHVGGDGAGNLEGNLPTQAPLALFSGVVKLDAEGRAKIPLEMPAFNGSVRVMAVAWSKTKVGAAEKAVIVRDPVVVAGTLPRFMDVGDRSRLHIELDNVEGAAGDYHLDVDIHGPVTADAAELGRTIKLAAHQRLGADLTIAAAGVGAAKFDVTLKGPGVDLSQHFDVGVLAGAADVYRRSTRPLGPGEALTISGDLTTEFLPGTGSTSVSASPFGAIDVPTLVRTLDRYPYGCTEQTVSRAMPLLYLNRLSSAEGLGVDPDIDGRIRGAIERVMSRQNASGAFGLWSADADAKDTWLDAYAADFLTRARERGFAVPQLGFDSALERLRNEVVNAADPGEGAGEPLAYALYVLARNGRPVVGDLRWLVDEKLETFKTPMAKGQLAAALAMLGDRQRASKLFSTALDGLNAGKETNASRLDYGSRLRDAAALVALLAESKMKAADIPGGEPVALAEKAVERARSERSYTSTQDEAWLILAAEALAETGKTRSFSLNGTEIEGAVHKRWTAAALSAAPVKIANIGATATNVTLTVAGNPIVPEPPTAQGYEIERTFYATDGNKIDLKNVKQNQRVVVVLKVTESEARTAKVLLVDRLPAGLEIDNPNLVDSGSLDGFDWLKKDVDAEHVEYLDDRLVAAFERQSGQSAFFSVAYVTRAVVPGSYVIPPATVEDMYRPDRHGRTGVGAIEIKPK